MSDSLGSIKVKTIKHIIHTFNDEEELSFEFILGSFFPKAFANMQSLLKDAYTQGYMQARMDESDEDQTEIFS